MRAASIVAYQGTRWSGWPISGSAVNHSPIGRGAGGKPSTTALVTRCDSFAALLASSAARVTGGRAVDPPPRSAFLGRAETPTCHVGERGSMRRRCRRLPLGVVLLVAHRGGQGPASSMAQPDRIDGYRRPCVRKAGGEFAARRVAVALPGGRLRAIELRGLGGAVAASRCGFSPRRSRTRCDRRHESPIHNAGLDQWRLKAVSTSARNRRRRDRSPPAAEIQHR